MPSVNSGLPGWVFMTIYHGTFHRRSKKVVSSIVVSSGIRYMNTARMMIIGLGGRNE
jgi:hypothetical protein